MAGGKVSWVEVETTCPNTVNNNPSKGGGRSKTARTVTGRQALSVGKVDPKIAKSRGTL